MRPETCSRLRIFAIGLGLACVWFDINLGEEPRPQLAGYDWRRTVDGWEETPRWQPPPTTTSFARPLLWASALSGAAAAALSTRSLTTFEDHRGDGISEMQIDGAVEMVVE
ncbi:MAG TPA: hypothetical protein VGJ26_21320 [Pirellulales bacterium]